MLPPWSETFLKRKSCSLQLDTDPAHFPDRMRLRRISLFTYVCLGLNGWYCMDSELLSLAEKALHFTSNQTAALHRIRRPVDNDITLL